MGTPIFIIEGDPDDTFTMNSTNVSQGIDAAKYEDASANPIRSMLVTVEDADIRIAFDIDPVSDGAGVLGHVVESGGSVNMTGTDACEEFRFISKVAGSHAKLMFTPFYFA